MEDLYIAAAFFLLIIFVFLYVLALICKPLFYILMTFKLLKNLFGGFSGGIQAVRRGFKTAFKDSEKEREEC